jgi:hypothetical protein
MAMNWFRNMLLAFIELSVALSGLCGAFATFAESAGRKVDRTSELFKAAMHKRPPDRFGGGAGKQVMQ